MPQIEQHNIPPEISASLRLTLSERDELRARLDIQETMLSRLVHVAALGLGLNPELNYGLSKDCSKFVLEVKDASNE